MRPALIAGIALIAIGAFLLIEGGTFTQKHNVIDVGALKVSATEEKSIPTWVGAVAIIAGVVVAAGGMKRNA